MATETLKSLLESGVHFGHQTRRWNPKMKRFIFGERSGIYIIDLEKTEVHLNEACEFARTIAAQGGHILFVGTKKQAKEVIQAEAGRCRMSYITHRWLGGLLTNFETVKQSLFKVARIEKMGEDGLFENLKKKEVATLVKEKEKILNDLGGIRQMSDLPQIVFIVDTKREDIAVREANKLGIPIIGIVDTNCDPDVIDYPIPGNDDALKSIRYVSSVIADAVLKGQKEFDETETLRRRAAEEPAPAEASQEPTAVAATAQEKPADESTSKES